MPAEPLPFSTVLNAELAQIDARRKAQDLAGDEALPAEGTGDDPLGPARLRDLVGLAFSGGGIRSATFNLGVLQGLAHLGLLKMVDYLSTVSGGGYIGAWLATCVYRKGGLGTVTDRLEPVRHRSGRQPDGSEPPEIVHLREHSRYLAPRSGFLSADGWVLWSLYLRNFLLNQFVLLPAAMAVLLVSRLVMVLYYPDTMGPHDMGGWAKHAPLLIGVVLAGVALSWACMASLRVRQTPARPLRPTEHHSGRGRKASVGPAQLLAITLLLALAAALGCHCAPYTLPPPNSPWQGLLWFVGGGVGAALLTLAVGSLWAWLWRHSLPAWKDGLALTICWIFGGLVGGLALYGVYRLLNSMFLDDGTQSHVYVAAQATAQLTTFGPPLVLLALIAAVAVGVGIGRHHLREGLREWWGSLGGQLLAAAAVWTSWNFVALYGTALILWATPWVKTLLASGWLATVAAGVLSGAGSKTGEPGQQGSFRELYVRLAFHVFVAGILILVSLLVHVLVDNPPQYEKAGEAVWPWRLEPEHSPTEVNQVRTSTPGGIGQESVRYDKRFHIAADETAVVWQRYWLGMLNTQAGFTPRLEPVQLPPADHRHPEPTGPSPIPPALAPLVQKNAQMRALFADSAKLQQLSRQSIGVVRDEVQRLVGDALPPDVQDRLLLNVRKVKPIEYQDRQRAGQLGLWLLGCLVVSGVFTRLVDVNLFSLHNVYGNRLVRAYLGAARASGKAEGATAGRHPDPVTGFDPDDDLPLKDLKVVPEPGKYDGPYLLVNTAMNLIHGDNQAWQDRKAESFVLTPLHCGSETTGYRPTERYGGPVSLGTAVTISGAAASPNMGYHSSAAVTFLLTVFNARLGAWLGNPNRPFWTEPGPNLGFGYLFLELFGWTNDRGRYVYLSDGGHFENLGAYELIRRRCRYVIICDAGQDGDHAFEDLGNLIAKCRVDFGIPIEIELDALRLQQVPRRARWHCAVGRIRYDLADPESSQGTLIYLKPSLTGDEPGDVLHYAIEHPAFPHETTGNQFFTESQFESYRALGQHVAEVVFQPAVAEMTAEAAEPPPAEESRSDCHRRLCNALFSSVVRQWFAMPPQYEPSFIETTKGYTAIQTALREDGRLLRLSRDLYPELAPHVDPNALPTESPAETAAREAAELSTIAQMLQVMETAWLTLKLDVYYAHPLNRGWMDVFHRWTSAVTVRRVWPLLRAEFSREFVSFCERQMRLGVVEGEPVKASAEQVLQQERFLLEFEDQWPADQWPAGLPTLRERLRAPDTRAWLLYPHNPYPGERPPDLHSIPAGVAIVSAAPDGGAKKVFELLVWMRGAYRNTGLGRPAVRRILKDLREAVGEAFRLRVHLPVRALVGPGGELQRQMWLTFYYHEGFVRTTPPDSSAEEIVLQREFP
jgi:hypothetical protein